MKRGFFTALATILLFQLGNAQTIKTGVLVIGNGNGAVAAGIQSSLSGAKTVLLMPGDGFGISLETKSFPSGVERGVIIEAKKTDPNNDDWGKILSDKSRINSVLNKWTDTIKNLTIIRSINWSKLKRSGSGWQLELSDGRKIKSKVLVNADRSGEVSKAISVPDKKNQWHQLNYQDKLYRTSIAVGQNVDNAISTVLFVSDLLVPEQDNLVVLDPQHQSFAAGEAAGATASYAAFFKKKTSEASIKAIQGELLHFEFCLVPFTDINPRDTNWKSIQFIGLSGFLKADINEGRASFKPDLVVSTAEIKEPIKEHYYKAQIWFDDYKEPQMTIGSTLSLVCYVGGKSPNNTEEEIKKNWKKIYKFKTEYDPKRNITRREFAVLVNEYMKPFNVTLDKSGRVLR